MVVWCQHHGGKGDLRVGGKDVEGVLQHGFAVDFNILLGLACAKTFAHAGGGD